MALCIVISSHGTSSWLKPSRCSPQRQRRADACPKPPAPLPGALRRTRSAMRLPVSLSPSTCPGQPCSACPQGRDRDSARVGRRVPEQVRQASGASLPALIARARAAHAPVQGLRLGITSAALACHRSRRARSRAWSRSRSCDLPPSRRGTAAAREAGRPGKDHHHWSARPGSDRRPARPGHDRN